MISNEELEELVKKNMDPHFLYNSLSVIRTITKRNPEYAYDLLYDFTAYLRGSVRSLYDDTPVPFSQELKTVKAYLSMEKMHARDKIKDVYEIEEDDFIVIPYLMHPLVENAVRHGLAPKKEGGTVTIRSYANQENYIIEVEDDGVGFQVEGVPFHGLDETKNIVETDLQGEMHIYSTVGQGTKVVITIPRELEEFE